MTGRSSVSAAAKEGTDLVAAAAAVAVGLVLSLVHPVLGVAVAAFVAAAMSGVAAALLATVAVAVGGELLSSVVSAMLSPATWVPAISGMVGAWWMRRRFRLRGSEDRAAVLPDR